MSADMTPSAFALEPDETDLIRSLILADPKIVLEDAQVMRTLIGATGKGPRKIVDLRDRLVERMETRLAKLIQTNRSVIAAAYENVAGTSSLHQAVLALMAARDLGAFLRCLTAETPALVGVDDARLCLEADIPDARALDELGEGLEGRVLAVPAGTVDAYLALGGEVSEQGVVLRSAGEEAEVIFGYPHRVRSEACIRLNAGGAAGLLVYGAADPERFGGDQGPELLHFLGGVVERLLVQRMEAAEAAP